MMTSKMSWRVLWILILATVSHSTLYSQDMIVRGGFHGDSTRVGDDLVFYLTARYPKTSQVLFPDSTFSFAPFELRKKDYFPTRTRDSVSTDSAVYILRTFEIERNQSLRLPVFIVNALDCTRVFSNRDTIALRPYVTEMPDSLTADLPLKASTAYQRVARQINGPLIIIVVSFVSVITAIAWVVFGPAINRHYRIKRLKQMHQSFSNSFETHMKTIQADFSPRVTEAAVVEWKKYMEQLSRKPFTKLTSLETSTMEKDEMLGKNLKIVDSAIYGTNTKVVDSLLSLKTYADIRFNQVITEVKNG
jgi:hypothetical protein